MLSKKIKIILLVLCSALFLFGLMKFLLYEDRDFYKIGPDGEFGTITIMGNEYIIFERYTSIFPPKQNFIRTQIKPDQLIAMQLTQDSTFRLAILDHVLISYELSRYKNISINNDDLTSFEELDNGTAKNTLYWGNFISCGYRTWESRYWYLYNDSTIMLQWCYDNLFFPFPSEGRCSYEIFAQYDANVRKWVQK